MELTGCGKTGVSSASDRMCEVYCGMSGAIYKHSGQMTESTDGLITDNVN